jgi:predicted HicB family RNase H-like nuclease
MATLTVRLPDDKHARLKNLARQRGISLNRLMDELATTALTEHDTYLRFQIRASRGSTREGLRLLDKLDS